MHLVVQLRLFFYIILYIYIRVVRRALNVTRVSFSPIFQYFLTYAPWIRQPWILRPWIRLPWIRPPWNRPAWIRPPWIHPPEKLHFAKEERDRDRRARESSEQREARLSRRRLADR